MAPNPIILRYRFGNWCIKGLNLSTARPSLSRMTQTIFITTH